MLQKTSGIILHTTKYSETSLIAKIYTRNFGLQSYIINGVRGKKSKNKAAVFQPLALVNLIASNSGKGNLQRISEITIDQPYTDIPYNIVKSSIAIFLNEVLYKSIKEDYSDDDLFEFIKSSLLILDLKTDNCSNFHICFLTHLSRFLGFYPQGVYSEFFQFFDLREGFFTNKLPVHSLYLKPQYSQILDKILNSNYHELHMLGIVSFQRKDILRYLIIYFQLHISTFCEIKSLDILEEVIS
jgi:DNA repair protein RecO (recombination protein O)